MNDITGEVGESILQDNLKTMKTKTKKEILKDYAVSSFITFIAAFALVIATDPSFNVQSFSDGAIVGVLLAALRAGVKAVVEYFVVKAQAKIV